MNTNLKMALLVSALVSATVVSANTAFAQAASGGRGSDAGASADRGPGRDSGRSSSDKDFGLNSNNGGGTEVPGPSMGTSFAGQGACLEFCGNGGGGGGGNGGGGGGGGGGHEEDQGGGTGEGMGGGEDPTPNTLPSVGSFTAASDPTVAPIGPKLNWNPQQPKPQQAPSDAQ